MSSELIEKVRQLLTQLAERLPMTVEEFEEELNIAGCTMFEDPENQKLVFDSYKCVEEAINKDCLDIKEDEFDDICELYTATRCGLAWLGLTCEDRKIVAVLRNLVIIEKEYEPAIIAHYSLANVIENEKLYNIVKNKVITNAEIKRLAEAQKELTNILIREAPNIIVPVIALGATLETIKLTANAYLNIVKELEKTKNE